MRKATPLFISGIIIDLASMNVYRDYSEETGRIVYFSGQSLAVLLYIFTVVLLSKNSPVLNIVSTAWLPFAVNDLIENLFLINNEVGYVEILCGMVSALIVIWKIHTIYLPASHRIMVMKLQKIKKSILSFRFR